ncbi:MAG: phage portal protein, partial [Bellilinea sp.]
MIGRTTIQQALSAEVAVSDTMLNAIGEWAKIYENKADWLSDSVKSLNLGAAISAEIARSSTMEMVMTVEGSPRALYLQAQLEKVMNRLREELERGCAKGGLVMKPYVDGDNINIDIVQADQFFPIRFDNSGNITACVFVDQRKIGDSNYTRLEYHDLTDSGYLVRNQAYKSTTRDTLGQQVPLPLIEDWAGLAPEATITGIEKPLYGYYRYPLANNIDPTSPVGVSCYSRAVDLIQSADVQWSDLLWEFESGKRALYVDVQAF